MFRILWLGLLLVCAAGASIVQEVRSAIRQGDFAVAEKRVAEYRAQHGATPEMIEAMSWLGRGALAASKLDEAERYAAETRKLALEALKARKLDDERRLPIALGASIEVQAQAAAAQGERDQAVMFLREEIRRWAGTSIVTRLNKNLNLLTLENKPAPAFAAGQWFGGKPRTLASLRGRPVLLFLWAHWCGDCKGMAPALAKVEAEFGPRGLAIVAPTQLYGYVAGGEEAPAAAELKYIDETRRKFYSDIKNLPVLVSEATFRRYGASTTPTVVLIDRRGIVRLYHPGEMSYEELAPRIAKLLANAS